MTNTDYPVNTRSIAPLKNVAALLALVDMLVEQPPDGDKFGLFTGFSGYGKSWAIKYVINKRDARMVEIFSYWTRKDFVGFLLKEFGGTVNHRDTCTSMMKEVIARAANDPTRPLLIDEADQLVDRGMIELVRDVQKATDIPVILVGEERLPGKLKAASERTDNRVLGRVLAQPCDVADAKVLARIRCPGITLSDALVATIVQQTAGNTRRIANTLQNVRTFSVSTGLVELDVGNYSGGIFTGAAPMRHAS
jgi:hypothetical protein